MPYEASVIFLSARQKLDVDLEELDRQIRLQQGEIVHRENDRPAQAYLNTPMVVIFRRDIQLTLINLMSMRPIFEIIKLSCSTQLRIKFILLINVGTLAFISRINITSEIFEARRIFTILTFMGN